MANPKSMINTGPIAKRGIFANRRFIRLRVTRAKAIIKKSIKIKRMKGPCFRSFDSLPGDVIVEVVSRVASSSVADFINLKLSCKALGEIGMEKYVMRQVSIEDFDISWRLHLDEALAFFQLCVDCNNPGALFQQGMYEYFQHVNLEEGVRNLEKAANLGHTTSAYVLGLILMCCGSENEKHKGMSLINRVKVRLGKRTVDCRIRLERFLNKIWLNNNLVRHCKPVSFPKVEQQIHDNCRRRCPWKAESYLLEDEDDILFCDACTCEFESKFFCHLFS